MLSRAHGAPFLACIFACTCMHAQVSTLGFETFTSENGLSDNYVLSAMQDSHGFLWFGTRDGLNRFDGFNFVSYRHDPGIPGSIADGSVKCVYEDSRGRMWIGTHSSGLDRFDRDSERFQHFRHNPHDSTSIGDGPVGSICEDRAGDLWIATRSRGDGVSRLDDALNRFTRFRYDPSDPYSISSNNVVSVCRDSTGAIWVATSDSGVNRYDPHLCGFVNHRTAPAYACSLWGTLDGAQTDRSGPMWVFAAAGLIRFDPATGSSHQELTNVVFDDNMYGFGSAISDRTGTCWITSYRHGVIAHNPAWPSDLILHNSPTTANSLASNTVFCAIEDNAGNFWFATEHGINLLNRSAWQFRWLRHDALDSATIAAPVVRSLAMDADTTLWIGTGDGGLDCVRNGASRAEHVPIGNAPGSATVNTICIDSHGNEWFGTNAGLGRRSPDGMVKTWRYDARDSSSLGLGGVWSILEDHTGRIWVGTLAGGLSLLDPATGTFRHYHANPNDSASLSNDAAISLCETRDGAIWIGTDNGLNRLDPTTGRFRHYVNDVDDPTSLSNNRVWYIHEDRHGALWIATSGGGVNKMDPTTGVCRRYTETNGLASNTVCAIVEDARGRIWASTSNGIACIDPEAETIRNFSTIDGLPVYEFHFKSCAQDRRGTIYFGGRDGVVCFHPDLLIDNAHVPPVAITEFHATIDTTFRPATSVTTARTVSLEHDNNSFSIEFAALDYTSPKRNHYRYMLEDYDDDWRFVPASHHFAEYTSVPPGHYRFLVAGANSDRPGYGPERVLEIEVRPAYWQTLWFRSMVVIVAAGGICGVLVARVRSVRRTEQTERRVVEYQLQALRAQMNPHFLFNSLNSILHFVVRRDIESAQLYLCTFSSLVRSTLENVRNDAVPLAEELESLRLYLQMESLRFRDRFEVSIDVAPHIDTDDVFIPPMIIQPYVENAIRHGLAHKEEYGRLSVRIARRMGYLRCSIIDDGVGRRRSEELQRGNLREQRPHSMAVTHNRLEALSLLHRQRYRVAVTDLVGTGGSALGTRVDILVPIDAGARSRSTTSNRKSS